METRISGKQDLKRPERSFRGLEEIIEDRVLQNFFADKLSKGERDRLGDIDSDLRRHKVAKEKQERTGQIPRGLLTDQRRKQLEKEREKFVVDSDDLLIASDFWVILYFFKKF